MKNLVPTEQISSIPRSKALVDAYQRFAQKEISFEELDEMAKQETITVIKALEVTGSSCISDGEQRKFCKIKLILKKY